MSFGSPLVLVGLAAVPLALLWYAARERQSRRAAAAFVAPRLADSVAPARPRWRRHVPLLLLLVAMAVLVAAAARPQRTVAEPVQRASIMLVTDVSSSMRATDVAPTRLAAAKKAAREFADKVPAGVSVGVMAFNQSPSLLQAPTRDRSAVDAAIERMTASGNTATGDAISTATGILAAQPALGGRRPPSAIVLLSDGKSTSGVDPVTAARAAARKKISVSTVALGTARGTVTVRTPGGRTVTRRVPPDPVVMAQVARVSKGQSFRAADAGKLSAVYQHLGSALGHEKHIRELTAGFAGGALVLILLGSALSLRWFGRLI